MKGRTQLSQDDRLVSVITKVNTQAVIKAGSNLEEQKQNQDMKCGILGFLVQFNILLYTIYL